MADLEEHFDDANPWNVVQSYMDKQTILSVKVEGIVNGGAIAMVEGLRGFIPASKLSLPNIKVGSVTTGKVETLQNYGAFVRLEDGLSGLVHVSQISRTRVKSPSDVLKTGDEVSVKIIGIKDGKISLSMKALEESREEPEEKVEIPKSENIGTSLKDLFKDIKL